MSKWSQIKSPKSEGYDAARAKAAEEEMLRQKAEQLRMEELQGSKIISSEQKKAILEKEARNKIYNEAIETGKTAEQAAQEVADSGIGSITPNLDRFKAENRKLAESRQVKQEQELGGFKTYGDKATFEAKNAIRKLRGQEPLAEPLPANKQFLVDLEKSASFGTESALVGSKAPKGQARAFEAGIRAGYTPEETRKLISDTAARITGVVDNKPAEPAATPSKFVTDFMAATPQKPVAPMTATERVSSGLDKSFFGGLSGTKPATTTPTPPPVVTDTLTTTPQEGSLFFPKVSNNTVVPMELMSSSLFNKKPTEPTSTRPEGFDQGEYDRYRKAGISEKRAEELASTPPLRQLLNKAGRFFTKESTSPLGF
jgi:hypothetical protein